MTRTFIFSCKLWAISMQWYSRMHAAVIKKACLVVYFQHLVDCISLGSWEWAVSRLHWTQLVWRLCKISHHKQKLSNFSRSCQCRRFQWWPLIALNLSEHLGSEMLIESGPGLYSWLNKLRPKSCRYFISPTWLANYTMHGASAIRQFKWAVILCCLGG